MALDYTNLYPDTSQNGAFTKSWNYTTVVDNVAACNTVGFFNKVASRLGIGDNIFVSQVDAFDKTRSALLDYGELYVTGISGGVVTTTTALGSGSLASPTAFVGLAAVPGVAATAMRSDAAPALSQAIVPTWLGLHTFSVGLAYAATLVGTTASATALAVGRQGITNPVLQVDASTASVITGLNIKGGANSGGLALSLISSSTNENLTVDAKGSGSFTVQGTATGAFIIGALGRFAALQASGYVGIGAAPTSGVGLLIDSSGDTVNQLKVRGTGRTGTIISQLSSSGAFQFNNQDNAQLEFYTNNGSGEQFILGTSGGGLRVGSAPPTPGAGGLGVTGPIVGADAISTTKSTNATFTAFSGTNTNNGAAANVTDNFAVTDAGTFNLQSVSIAGGSFSIIRWTGSGGLFFDQKNAAGTMEFRTGATPTSALIISAAQNLTVPVGSLLALSPTAGMGYGTGAGGTVTQLTNRNTGVTLNKVSGDIVLFSQVNAAVSGATATAFTVTNSTVAITDTIDVVQKSGTDKYLIYVTNVAAGSFAIQYFAPAGGTTNEAPVFHFNVMKGVNA